MRKIEFRLKEQSKANKLYFLLDYAGGDADTEHPVNVLLPFSFSDYENHIDEIEKRFDFYKILQGLIAERDTLTYTEIKEEHGDVMASAFENVPLDPQADYQFKCYLDSISLIGYDSDGAKHISYL